MISITKVINTYLRLLKYASTIYSGMYILYTSSGKCHGINSKNWLKFRKNDKKFFRKKAIINNKLTINYIFELLKFTCDGLKIRFKKVCTAFIYHF